MSKIVIFGGGGKAGRAATLEAIDRGHQVTTVVRDPSQHTHLAGDGVEVVAGDVLDPDAVARIATGHDAAISAVYDPQADPAQFFPAAAESLLQGLPKAGIERALVIGLVSTLEVAPGVRMLDTPDFPEQFKGFGNGHLAGLEAFRSSQTELDWLVLSPPMVLDEGPRTGTYRVGGDQVLTKEDGTGHISYADLAIALIDEIDTPKNHRTRISVAD